MENLTLAPIVLFVYNRPWHTQQTLEALSKNELANHSELFIYSDGPKEAASADDFQKINEVRELIKEKNWCRSVQIIESRINKGLADSIIEGVTKIVKEYGRIIVLEDDIVTSKGFLRYMNDALELYKNEEKVMHISGYIPPISEKGLPDTFFYNQTSCWGWGTWNDSWVNFKISAIDLKEELDKRTSISHFNIDGSYDFYSDLIKNISGEMKTWAIKWHTSVYLKNGLCLHPKKSLAQNIGFDSSGIHCGKSDKYNTEVSRHIFVKKSKNMSENILARKRIVNFNLGRVIKKENIWYNVLQSLKTKILD